MLLDWKEMSSLRMGRFLVDTLVIELTPIQDIIPSCYNKTLFLMITTIVRCVHALLHAFIETSKNSKFCGNNRVSLFSRTPCFNYKFLTELFLVKNITLRNFSHLRFTFSRCQNPALTLMTSIESVSKKSHFQLLRFLL